MDQEKIGSFMKNLRKEHNLTQEELAEKMFVSRRTVSRWETGNNMPDIEVLIQIADLYEVDLRELLNGERKTETMRPEIKETAILASDYTNENNERMRKIYHVMFIVAAITGAISLFLEFADLSGHLFDFLKGIGAGITFGMTIVGALYTSKNFRKIAASKKSVAS
ncbi:MAG: helix-turn-helix domain-containing protein [Saccharofermentans sp.]|nr:helix-turn-helix domain-containing protein [Saccharofermentans sp.]